MALSVGRGRHSPYTPKHIIGQPVSVREIADRRWLGRPDINSLPDRLQPLAILSGFVTLPSSITSAEGENTRLGVDRQNLPQRLDAVLLGHDHVEKD
jgi:hypothetical protein